MSESRLRSFASGVLSVLLLQAALSRAQQLTIQTGTGKPTVLTRANLEALPRASLTVTASSGNAAYEGVPLKALLEKAGFSFEHLMGKQLASCLVVEAADGYRVVIALPELDPAFGAKQVVLAFLKDGKPLDQKEGPYRVVIPEEKRMARWVRQVTTLKMVNVE